MEPTGRKEVGEAVLIAALCTFVTGLVTWGFEESKRRLEALRAKNRKLKKAKR